MRTPRIVEAMNYIDDDLVSWAVEYKRNNKKKNWLKWGAIAACLCLILASFPVIQNMSRPQVSDTIELTEVNELSLERVEKKLIGEYRENILHSWGEPDDILTETSDKYYLDEDNNKYIILYYDNKGYIQEILIGYNNPE